MPNINVSNSDQLKDALRASSGGGTIYLSPGDYGSLKLSNYKPTSLVKIVATEPLGAHFDNILVERSQNLSFSALKVSSFDEVTPAMGRTAIAVGESRNITFSDLHVSGNGDGNPINDVMGIRVRYSSNVTIENSFLEELHRGSAVSFSSGINIRNNTILNMAEDGLDFAQVTSVRVAGNYIGEFSAVHPGIHPDAIQFMTAGTTKPSSNIEIIDNVLYQGNGATFQGLFMGNEAGIPYSNVLINNNLVYTQQYHGISVGNASNVKISNNTALSQSGDAAYSWIMLDKVANAAVFNNVAEDLFIKPSSQAKTANNLEVLNLPNLADLLPGMSDSSPSLVDLIVGGRGYQMRTFGSSLEGARLSVMRESLQSPGQTTSMNIQLGVAEPSETHTLLPAPAFGYAHLEAAHWALP